MKDDGKDVNIVCYGHIRGCLVAYCNIASDCHLNTVVGEVYNEQDTTNTN